MPLPIDVLLCEYETSDSRRQLRAVLDELTLTYTIVDRDRGGRKRMLRRHVSSLREARAWASSHPTVRPCAQELGADRAA